MSIPKDIITQNKYKELNPAMVSLVTLYIWHRKRSRLLL